jgi:acyl carrier protein
MLTADDLLAQVRATLGELFDLPPERVEPEARLYDDLEIDSIDVVDLIEVLRRQTNRRVSAEDFRAVRTVADLITVLERLLQ